MARRFVEYPTSLVVVPKTEYVFSKFLGKELPRCPLGCGPDAAINAMQSAGSEMCFAWVWQKHLCSSDALPIYFTRSCQKKLTTLKNEFYQSCEWECSKR